jgi:hypothetical protein
VKSFLPTSAGVLAAAVSLAVAIVAHASAPTVHLQTLSSAPTGSDLQLTVGLALDDGNPATCGTAASLAVHAGDAVNFCYTLTNGSGHALSYHTLVDSVDGTIFSLLHHEVAAGATYRFNRVVTASLAADTYAATWTAQDLEPGYAASTITPAFVDISTTGTALTLADDTATGVTLPFAFALYGSASNLLTVGNNGTLVLGTLDGFSYSFNDPLPNANDVFMGGALILPFWDDLVDSAGGVYWQVTGNAPQRRVIVQWSRPHFLQVEGARVEVEAILGEDGSLSFQYANSVFGDPANPGWDNGGSATIGLQNVDATIANQYSFDTPALAATDAIAWTPTAPTAFSANASVHLDVAPALVPATVTLTPDPLGASASPGGAAVSIPLQIANSGDIELQWSALEAPATIVRAGDASGTAPHASTPEQRKRAANLATRDRFRASVPDTVSVRGSVTPGCDESTPGIIVHDDGTPEDGYRDGSGLFTIAGYADRFTPSVYPSTFTSACVSFLAIAENTSQDFQLVVYDDSGFDGGPGNLLASVNATASNIPTTATAAFVRVDLAGLGISVQSGSVYIGVLFDPTSPTGVFVASDVNGAPNAASGFLTRGSPGSLDTWEPIVDQFSDYHSLLVRAVERPDACATTSDVPWLSLSATSGTVDGHDAATITATLDPAQLVAGEYDAALCIATNDPAHPHVTVPVHFSVGDTIFTDGFELPST